MKINGNLLNKLINEKVDKLAMRYGYCIELHNGKKELYLTRKVRRELFKEVAQSITNLELAKCR